tara:strand:- start:20100 stop:21914 length:1815 start_codon:yes stop_codon:yes gene_type:complete
MVQKRGKAERLAGIFSKIFHVHRRRDTESTDPGDSCAPTPSHLYRFKSPKVQVNSTPKSSLSSTTIDSEAPSPSPSGTAPTASDPADLSSRRPVGNTASNSEEYKSALAGLRNAERILQERHAAIEQRGRQGVTKKKCPPAELITAKNGSAMSEARIASLPSQLSVPSYRQRQQAQTAEEACNALQCRKLLREMAYRAKDGCKNAVAAIEELNAHLVLQARHEDDKHIPDLILNFESTRIRASMLRAVERTWISRFNATWKLQSLVARKHLGMEDYEVIVKQLFPGELKDLLKPEHYEIFATGLATESIITSGEAKSLVALGVSRDEFEQGERWTGASFHRHNGQYRHKASALINFDIPKQAHRNATPNCARRSQINLYPYLRVLAEAAVYNQKYWKGYFFANARSMLSSYYEANQLQSKGLSTPPSLTDYKRPWTYREVRLLRRGHLICTLLRSLDNGKLTDFGIIRAIRGSYVGIPGQGYWDAEELSSYLYHRIAGSGLAVSKVPEIIALHPEHDKDFANVRLRATITRELQESAVLFEREEEQRLSEIEMSITKFEWLRKKKMTRWERAKKSWQKWLCKESTVKPFDPFAEEHGESMLWGK